MTKKNCTRQNILQYLSSNTEIAILSAIFIQVIVVLVIELFYLDLDIDHL